MPQHRTSFSPAVLILLAVLAGCAAGRPAEDIALKDAQAERTAAAVRLAKALTRYCTVVTDTLRARDGCLVEQQFSALDLDALNVMRPFRAHPQSAELIPPGRPSR